MDEPQRLNHSKWECKYHVVFIPKCRRKTLYAQLRRHLGEVFRRLADPQTGRAEGKQDRGRAFDARSTQAVFSLVAGLLLACCWPAAGHAVGHCDDPDRANFRGVNQALMVGVSKTSVFTWCPRRSSANVPAPGLTG
jgi:hypothetical protein